jgi:hypothetical protein
MRVATATTIYLLLVGRASVRRAKSCLFGRVLGALPAHLLADFSLKTLTYLLCRQPGRGVFRSHLPHE